MDRKSGNMFEWDAQWIWTKGDMPANTWMCVRKTFELNEIPRNSIARISAESKYWMWINGKLIVFEGSLNRGPKPGAGYYDVISLKECLFPGVNTIAILVWYWGNQGRNNVDSGAGGLLFQAELGALRIKSDCSWKIRVHPAYFNTGKPEPSYLYGGHNIGFDACKDIKDWNEVGFDDSEWINATEKGIPPCAPWNDLWERPIPLFKDYGVKNYKDISYTCNGEDCIVVASMHNASHVTPYFKIKANCAGLAIDIRTDRYFVNGGPGDETNVYNSHRTEYITRSGVQEFESLDWLFGEAVLYIIPHGVEIIELKYRKTGYDADFAGTFTCNDYFYNRLYEKAARTLYVCMRDNFMDCPDRERGQWIGDVSSQTPQVFYSLDRKADKLVLKAIRDFINWKSGDVLRGNVPGIHCGELPSQSLNAICDRGMIMSYYMSSGDYTVIHDSYNSVKNYLNLWDIGDEGLIITRTGYWNWFDHGSNIDAKVLENTWYYMALKSAVMMAEMTGNIDDICHYRKKMDSIEGNFERVLWKGDGFRSGAFNDDRANAMAVLSGLCGTEKWEIIKSILNTVKNATPYMEGYVLEALFLMHYEDEALKRMKDRYESMVANSNTTLWEDFYILGTRNHAWSGGSLTLLCQYVAGIAPEVAGYEIYHILPQIGQLREIDADIPSIKGNIKVSIRRNDMQFSLRLISPIDTIAVVGIPKNAFDSFSGSISLIKVDNIVVWANGKYIGDLPGISWNEEDAWYIKFNVSPGNWYFIAETSMNGMHS